MSQDYGRPPFLDHIDERFVMSDLDKKLREAIKTMRLRDLLSLVDQAEIECIEQIKRAFIDAGWVDNPELTILNYRYDFRTKQFYHIQTKEHGVLMTGLEWYDRFESTFEASHYSTLIDCRTDREKDVMKSTALLFFEAAKKAAGIE